MIQTKAKRPLTEQIFQKMIYADYTQLANQGLHTTRWQRQFGDGFTIEVVWTALQDHFFQISLKGEAPHRSLEQNIAIKGKEKFLDTFKADEQALINAARTILRDDEQETRYRLPSRAN